jgi:hypothetical protein
MALKWRGAINYIGNIMARKNNNQLNLFDRGVPQTSTRKIHHLESAISDGLQTSDIAGAKQAAQEQEELLKKLIEEKKRSIPRKADRA